ncbi:MAG: hypothetical protein GY800_04120 [Planctomycetes bacterium]|nr:hypothetical protein [Planctomycetota bacterium]
METVTDRAEVAEESPTETEQVQAPVPKAEIAIETAGNEFPPEKEGVTWKQCNYPDCGKKFGRREGEPAGTWKLRLYCCPRCKTQQRIIRRDELRKIGKKPVDTMAIAAEAWEELYPLVTHTDTANLDAVRSLCLKFGLDCLRRGGVA